MKSKRQLLIALANVSVIGMFVNGKALAQAAKPPARIGFLMFNIASIESAVDPFREGMRELGHVEGRTYVLEIRNADSKAERFPALAAELVGMKVDVLVASSAPGIQAAKNATSSIPVVFGGSGDPIARGLVQSLARPGGNATGTSLLLPELGPKKIELLKAASPKLSRLSLLTAPTLLDLDTFTAPMSIAASRFGINFKQQRLAALGAEPLEAAFATMQKEGTNGVIVFPDPVFFANIDLIGRLTLKYRMPSMAPYREIPRAGGLMSYFPRLQDSFKGMAPYVDKILKGRKPSDLPVEQPTRFHLAINMKTAKALGLTIPGDLLLRADEVIE